MLRMLSLKTQKWERMELALLRLVKLECVVRQFGMF